MLQSIPQQTTPYLNIPQHTRLKSNIPKHTHPTYTAKNPNTPATQGLRDQIISFQSHLTKSRSKLVNTTVIEIVQYVQLKV